LPKRISRSPSSISTYPLQSHETVRQQVIISKFEVGRLLPPHGTILSRGIGIMQIREIEGNLGAHW
jgi:hypothetical protein